MAEGRRQRAGAQGAPIAEIADIARDRRDRKSKTLNHKGHKGTRRKSSEIYVNLGPSTRKPRLDGARLG
jgi:hypothetical protein